MLENGGGGCTRTNVVPPERRVLIVENDRELRECMQHVLEDEGFSIVAAEHGIGALETLRSGCSPDVIVLDLMMPIMDGWDFLDSIHHDPNLGSIPVVVITGASGKVVHERISRALRKPVDLDELLEAIRSA